MAGLKDRPEVTRLEVVDTGVVVVGLEIVSANGRRMEEEKLRIVTESRTDGATLPR
jgi:hypothetical protein